MSTARSLTLADVAIPRAGVLQNLLLIVTASLVTAVAAQLEIRLPWTPVPLTGQTFAVMLTGAVLGWRRAFLAQALYLLEGTLGLPVFAGGTAGVGALLGPSGGYLMSFPLAAATTGWLCERGWDRHAITMAAAMLAASGVVFVCGLAWLARFLPASHLLAAGLLPFVPGDVVKATLAALAFPAVWKRVGGMAGGRA
jgi:biotin transport system substrate-specific component